MTRGIEAATIGVMDLTYRGKQIPRQQAKHVAEYALHCADKVDPRRAVGKREVLAALGVLDAVDALLRTSRSEYALALAHDARLTPETGR